MGAVVDLKPAKGGRQLSQHPEAVRARKRRKAARGAGTKPKKAADKAVMQAASEAADRPDTDPAAAALPAEIQAALEGRAAARYRPGGGQRRSRCGGLKSALRAAYRRRSTGHDPGTVPEVGRIRVRAERRMGEIVQEMERTGERATRQTAREVGSSRTARLDRGSQVDLEEITGPANPSTLADLGISRDRASRAMQLAEVMEGRI